jgi:hypothetical protein
VLKVREEVNSKEDFADIIIIKNLFGKMATPVYVQEKYTEKLL